MNTTKKELTHYNRRNKARHARSVAAVRSTRFAVIEESIFDAASEQVNARAVELGLALTHSVPGNKGVRQSHYGFFRDGWRVADYWPVTETLRVAGVNHNAASLSEALEAVAKIVGPAASNGPHGPRPKGQSRGRHSPRPIGTADRPERR